MACNTSNNVVAIDCHLIVSYLLAFISLTRAGSVLQADMLDLTVAEAPLIPGNIVRAVIVPQLLRRTKQFTT